MDRDEFYRVLVEFFRDEFQSDPIGVGDWLAQGGQDVEVFCAEINKLHPEVDL